MHSMRSGRIFHRPWRAMLRMHLRQLLNCFRGHWVSAVRCRHLPEQLRGYHVRLMLRRILFLPGRKFHLPPVSAKQLPALQRPIFLLQLPSWHVPDCCGRHVLHPVLAREIPPAVEQHCVHRLSGGVPDMHRRMRNAGGECLRRLPQRQDQ